MRRGKQHWKKKTTDSSKIRNVFMSIMSQIEAKSSRENLVFPKEVVWVIGPPKSGKTTWALFIQEHLQFRSMMIPLRSICRSVIARHDGKLDMNEIVEELLKRLLIAGQDDSNGVIVDDFNSVTCARILPFLHKYIEKLNEEFPENDPTKFRFCILDAKSETSVNRQMTYSNEFETEEEARNLYAKFIKRVKQSTELLKMNFNFNVIDSNSSFVKTQPLVLKEIMDPKNGTWKKNASLRDSLRSNPTISMKALSRQAYPNDNSNQQNNGRRYRRGGGNRRDGYGRDDKSNFKLERGGNRRGRGRGSRRGRGGRGGRGRNQNRRANNTYDQLRSYNSNTSDISLDLYFYQQYAQSLNSRSLSVHNSLSNQDVRQTLYPLPLNRARSNLLSCVNGLSDAVNAITIPNEIEILTKRINQILNVEGTKRLHGPHVRNISDLSRPFDKSKFKLQWRIKGWPCMLYWSPGGLCYFVDYNYNFMELASNQYRNTELGETLVDGGICYFNNKIIFVINDIVMKSSATFRGAYLDERAQVMETMKKSESNQIKSFNGPITICVNTPKNINDANVRDASSMSTAGLQAFANNSMKNSTFKAPVCGYLVVPVDSTFQYADDNPGYLWAPKNSDLTFKDVKKLLLSKTKN